MSAKRLCASCVALFVLSAASAALAGAPLKGIDVKLGKNPGGSVASRTTNAAGVADFGVLPVGDYTVTVSGAAPPRVHLSISGALGGRSDRDLNTSASARQAPVSLRAGGRERVVVTVSAD